MEQKKISAKEAVADIKAGMSDNEIMKKYGLSAKGLQNLFTQLHQAKLISTEEYNRRAASSEHPVELLDEGGEKVSPPTEKSLEILKDLAEKFKFSKEDLDRLKAASFTDIKQLLEKYNISVGEGKELLKTLGISAGILLAQAAGKLKDGTRRLKGDLQQRQPSTGEKEDQLPAPMKDLKLATKALFKTRLAWITIAAVVILGVYIGAKTAWDDQSVKKKADECAAVRDQYFKCMGPYWNALNYDTSKLLQRHLYHEGISATEEYHAKLLLDQKKDRCNHLYRFLTEKCQNR